MQIDPIRLEDPDRIPEYPLLIGDRVWIGIQNKLLVIDTQNRNLMRSASFPTGQSADEGPMNETPVVCQDRIIVRTRYQVLCFSLPNLDLLCSRRFKQHCSLAKCSVFERTLYLLRWNEILKIDVLTGQVLLKRKYRVKWFDSPLQVFHGRYFAATIQNLAEHTVPD
ncbi:hypothetical protein J19TS2_06880 [Cohnella xylanilytica]|uniref:CNH domain-containing protein n=1 Tax=Cohnella xylanilytica TaxID=557555 RepID=A0A841U1K3_9BACL|nr:hypothetical protein [Cohnella xylanilytica]MBB6691990.1 hypothetical protein [Cohnella xylanilytica]GIO11133.1 hypothetical protein J19TS2_06880 [Cohnella xylanilytica]